MKLAIGLADADSEDDREWEKAWDALEHAVKDWERNMRQKRAGKARWAGMTMEQRRDAMRAAWRARTEQALSLAKSGGKGKRRPTGGG